MVAAFTADYMEVINCLSVAGGVRSKPIKLPEPESWRDAVAQASEWKQFANIPGYNIQFIDKKAYLVKDARCHVCNGAFSVFCKCLHRNMKS